MSYLTVAAEDVQVGDQINMGVNFAINPNHRWANVRKIKRVIKKGVTVNIIITAGGCQTWLNPSEGVAIQRFDDLAS